MQRRRGNHHQVSYSHDRKHLYTICSNKLEYRVSSLMLFFLIWHISNKPMQITPKHSLANDVLKISPRMKLFRKDILWIEFFLVRKNEPKGKAEGRRSNQCVSNRSESSESLMSLVTLPFCIKAFCFRHSRLFACDIWNFGEPLC